jgi:putative transposase
MKRLEFVNSFAINRSGFGLMEELNHGSLFLSIVRFGLKNLTNANKLGAMARQASAERAWASISRFNENVKKGIKGKKVGFPKFQKNCRSVEYKTNSWKLSEDRKSISFTHKCGIGLVKMKGTRELGFYAQSQIKRVRLVKRADGFYIQFCVSADRVETVVMTGKTVGLDVGLKEFYTDSNGEIAPNPKFLPRGEAQLKPAQSLVSRKVKGGSNRQKARVILGKRHLKISRQPYCTMLSSWQGA